VGKILNYLLSILCKYVKFRAFGRNEKTVPEEKRDLKLEAMSDRVLHRFLLTIKNFSPQKARQQNFYELPKRKIYVNFQNNIAINQNHWDSTIFNLFGNLLKKNDNDPLRQ